MIKMIAAVSKNGIIGIDGQLPWAGVYPEDMKFFRTMTKNSILIMGRKTFESIGNKPLPARRNIVISRSANTMAAINVDGIEAYESVKEAIDMCDADTRDIWIVGGERIYEAGMEFAEEIYLTMIPQWIDIKNTQSIVRFPWINPLEFQIKDVLELESSPKIKVIFYKKTISNYSLQAIPSRSLTPREMTDRAAALAREKAKQTKNEVATIPPEWIE